MYFAGTANFRYCRAIMLCRNSLQGVREQFSRRSPEKSFAVPPLALMAWYSEGLDGIVQSVLLTSWKGWSVVLWQSIGNTLIGYGLWHMLLGRYSAATVTPWALLVPVFGMSASALLLGEPLPWWKLVALGLIFGGLALNMLSTRK